MHIYICLIIYTLGMAFLYSHMKRQQGIRIGCLSISLQKCIMFMLMTLPSILVSGLRYGISVDYTKIYERNFYLIANKSLLDNGFENGFVYLVSLCSQVVNQPWFMFLIVSIFTIVIFFMSFKQSENYFFTVALFFGIGIYFDTFNGIRQYIVVAMFCYVMKFIREKNLKNYMLCISICILFHTSAIFLLPLYFLYKLKINKKYILIISTILLLFHNKLIQLITMILGLIPKYNNYLLRGTLQNQVSFSLSGLMIMLLAIIPCLLVESEMKKTDIGKFLYNMMMVGFVIAVSSSFLPFAERLLYYTKAYTIFAIPYACSLLKGRIKTIITLGESTALYSMTFIGMISLGWYAVLPYCSIFSKP